MSITIGPPLETELRAKAEAEGITVEAYLERLLRGDREAMNELADLALEGLNSGEPILPGPEYWADKHRKLDERFKSAR
jgi:hypothetical protein